MQGIKFRAWDTKRNKMWSAEQLGSDQVGLLPDGRGFANISGESHDRTVLFEHLIPLQYTGLNDKNGIEIYECDTLMSCEGIIYTTMFDPQGYWCIDGNGARNSEMLSENLKDGCVWKIGNIYEEVNNE